VLCLVTSPVVGSNAHKSLCFLMLIVRLFHVEHSVAVAAGAAFAVPLPWSPGGVGACELSWAARQAPLKDDEKGGIMPGSRGRSGPSSPGRAILSQDAVFSVDALCKCGKPRLGRWSY